MTSYTNNLFGSNHPYFSSLPLDNSVPASSSKLIIKIKKNSGDASSSSSQTSQALSEREKIETLDLLKLKQQITTLIDSGTLADLESAKKALKVVYLFAGKENFFIASRYAYVLMKLDNQSLEEAEQIFQKAYSLSEAKTDLFTLKHYANVCRKRGNLVQAEKIFSEAMSYGGHEDLFTLIRYADTLRLLGKYLDAEKKIIVAIPLLNQDSKEIVFAFNSYGAILLELERSSEARCYFEKIFALPSYEATFFSLTRYAEVLRRLGQLYEAEKVIKEVEIKFSSLGLDLFSFNSFAETYRQLGDLQKAKKFHEKAYSLREGRTDLLTISRYADTLRQLGDLQLSATLFRIADSRISEQTLVSERVFIWTYYADTMLKLKNYTLALNLFKKVSDIPNIIPNMTVLTGYNEACHALQV